METQDRRLRQRILDYNEDDCIAMRVLLDALRGMAK
ncbi:MAG: ribonuclease H-like domain-containing protein [Thermodesulfobacteriota bacterium]